MLGRTPISVLRPSRWWSIVCPSRLIWSLPSDSDRWFSMSFLLRLFQGFLPFLVPPHTYLGLWLPPCGRPTRLGPLKKKIICHLLFSITNDRVNLFKIISSLSYLSTECPPWVRLMNFCCVLRHTAFRKASLNWSQKQQKFINLTQGEHWVDKYDWELMRLKRFTPSLVDTEQKMTYIYIYIYFWGGLAL